MLYNYDTLSGGLPLISQPLTCMINQTTDLPEEYLHHSTCPACGFHLALDFYAGGHQPLATLGWPHSPLEAQTMPRLPLAFVRCLQCGHIFNRLFDYTQVPYVNNPNRMYNRSPLWREHLEQVCARIQPCLPTRPTVVEIGCGEAHLLALLASTCPHGRFIGFDPHADLTSPHPGVEIRAQLFEPAKHLIELKPDILISRHVLEHLMNPLAFIQETAFFCSWYRIFPLLFVEVPCIDRALETGRMEDFYYEHNSHFSTQSFTRFLQEVNPELVFIETGYGHEVIYGMTRFKEQPDYLYHARQTLQFYSQSISLKASLSQELTRLATEGRSMAIWGGTGKGAAFLNTFGMTPDLFPLVVDSDPAKVGTCVPGIGQRIQSKDILKTHPVDIIIIASQWRARDIVSEIESSGIPFQRILLEYQGQLVDYFQDPHPYR